MMRRFLIPDIPSRPEILPLPRYPIACAKLETVASDRPTELNEPNHF